MILNWSIRRYIRGSRITSVEEVLSTDVTAADAPRSTLHITQQAQIIAHIDDYKLSMIATLAVLPRLIVFKKAPGGSADHTLAVE